MAKFDFIEASSAGYGFVWQKRKALLSLSVMPVAVKTICFMAVYFLGLEENFLRSGLVLLPSYFATGWLAAFAVRMALYEEGWLSFAPRRVQALGAGMVLYVLIKLLLGGVFGYMMMQDFLSAPMLQQESGTDIAQPNAMWSLMMVALLVGLFLSVRLMWLYVPVAMGVSIRAFLRRTTFFNTAFSIIGMWLVCSIPVLMVTVVFSGFIYSAFSSGGQDVDMPLAFSLLMAPVQAVSDTLIVLISSVAMAYGVQTIMGKKEG